MATERDFLKQILVQLQLLNDRQGKSSGTGSEGSIDTTTLETLITETNNNTSRKNYELDIQETTIDGSTDTSNVVGLSINLVGDGGSINGVQLPSGTTITSVNEDGGLITNSISYTVPTSTGGRVIITYNREV